MRGLESSVIRAFVPASTAKTRREFLGEAGIALSAVMAAADGHATETDPLKTHTIQLDTRRSMGFLELGAGEKHGIFVHGLLGSGNSYSGIDGLLKQQGIRGIAPHLYGNTTEWQKRQSVMDAGHDIAALSAAVYGPDVRPTIVGCSAGIKESIAACIALNTQENGTKVSQLYLVSGQVDMNRSDVFNLLNKEEQFKLNALRGVAKEARLRILQPLRNAGANLKHRIAHRKVQGIAQTPLAAQEILSKLSPEDHAYLRDDPALRTTLFNDASSYSYGEIVDSIDRLFGWNLDLRKLAGTNITIMHGTKDTLVHPHNATILEGMIKQAGVQNVKNLSFPDGHLLLRVRAEEILNAIKRNLTK